LKTTNERKKKMNEKLQEALAEIINLTLQGKDFAIEQAPDVVSQLLAWNMVCSLILSAIGIIMLILTAVFLKKVIPAFGKGGWVYDNDLEGVPILVVGIALMVAILIISSNLDWIQILIAPKVYLIEYNQRKEKENDNSNNTAGNPPRTLVDLRHRNCLLLRTRAFAQGFRARRKT
jgi:hypothetical protein